MLDYQIYPCAVRAGYQGCLLPLSVPLHYDNVQEQPIPEGGSIEEYASHHN